MQNVLLKRFHLNGHTIRFFPWTFYHVRVLLEDNSFEMSRRGILFTNLKVRTISYVNSTM